MNLIAALSRDHVIGEGDGMPWDVPEEYQHFLSLVSGTVVIMGRRSYEIFGADLRDSLNVVVSTTVDDLAGARVVSTLEQAIEVARSAKRKVFSAGGASIYRQTLPLAERLYLSYIHGSFSGDSYFPQISDRKWEVEHREEHARFEFVVYRKRDPAGL